MPRGKFDSKACVQCHRDFEPLTGNVKRCQTCRTTPVVRPTKLCALCSEPFLSAHSGHIWCAVCVPKKATHGNTPYAYYARHYGLSKQRFDAMMRSQNDACAVCKRLFKEMSSKNIHVDHCHDTGIVRGILCVYCNRGIECFFNDSESLRNAADYLEKTYEETQDKFAA